MTTLKN